MEVFLISKKLERKAEYLDHGFGAAEKVRYFVIPNEVRNLSVF
jgi:hypothetical protein